MIYIKRKNENKDNLLKISMLALPSVQFFGTDLKLFESILCNSHAFSSLKVFCEYRQDLVYSIHGVRSMRKLRKNKNNMKIKASISSRRRNEVVNFHGEPNCCTLG